MVQNFALSKKKTIGCMCGHSALLALLKIIDLPSFSVSFSKLEKVTIKFFNPLQKSEV